MTSKITALKQQKRNPDRVNVYLDGEFAFGVAKIVAAWLEVGISLDEGKIRQLQAKDDVEKAYQRALNFLSYRPRSIAEVERNLRKHSVDELVVEEVLARLQEKNWLDDEKFAAAWVENRNTFRPRGRYALQAELRQKGVSDRLIELTLSDLDEDMLARQAAEKKAKQLRGLEEEDFRKKLYAYLARRGFDYGLISEVCAETWGKAQAAQKEPHPEKGTRKSHGN